MIAAAHLLAILLAATSGEPLTAPPPPESAVKELSGSPSLMRDLARRGLHDLNDESWNVYGQLTFISSWKPSFPAAYTNLNGSTGSLSPDSELSFTYTATLFVGVRPWRGGEVYFVPEVIAENPFSQLHGLSLGIQNFELQKTGGSAPQLYRSQIYVRQTIGLGGGTSRRESDQMQLGGLVERRRIVFTVGNFSALDFFDRNSFTSDPRQQYLSLGFMTHVAWDFASDARGYSWGGAIEVYQDDWALRLARLSPPINPNQLPVGLRLDRYYGDVIEIEHQHRLFGREGALRLLGFRNRELMGRFDDAIGALRADQTKNAAACTSFNYGSQNATAPDLCWVRAPNVKVGIGIDVEQHLSDDAGVFFRAMWADGQTEVQAYTSADRSLSFGALARGSAWNRRLDVAGAGAGLGSISHSHAEYLRLGGIDAFIGDGTIREAPEANFELFYSVNFLVAFWLTGDYQHVWNPAFNADRGPVNVFGLRLHAQY